MPHERDAETRAAIAIARALLSEVKPRDDAALIGRISADIARTDPEAAAFLPSVLARVMRP